MLEMREFLNKKVGKKGFTLAELLVVVAILAVLVAVSIPIFTGRLDASKVATDEANLRAAKSVGVNEYLAGTTTTAATKYYKITEGKLVDSAAEFTGKDLGQAQGNKDKVIAVKFTPAAINAGTGDTTKEGEVGASWVAKK